MKNSINIFSIPIIKWLVIPFLLILLWLSFSLVFISKESFTVLTYNNNYGTQDSSVTKLLKGKKITGIFKAENNNLGIVTIRIGNVPINDEKQDLIVFKLREKGQKNWLTENTYYSGSFIPNKPYPFGFNEQRSSKNKIYEIELLSLYGNSKNAIEIKTKNNNPIYQTKYKFTISELINSQYTLWSFIQSKFIYFFTDIETLYFSLFYLLPLFLYLAWNLLPIQSYDKKLSKLSTVAVLFILFDVISLKFVSTWLILFLIGLWIYSLKKNKIKSSKTFKLSFILLLLSIISIYSKLGFSVDKATTYVYILILVGLIQSMQELGIIRGMPRKRSSLQKRR
jgi:hypothetical protein